MKLALQILIAFTLLFTLTIADAASCTGAQARTRRCRVEPCCGRMGGINYCDSSAGRLVCNNGYYSSCYCDRHAIMDFQRIEGCCLWQGGVLAVEEAGMIICNNGGVSEVCSLAVPPSTYISNFP